MPYSVQPSVMSCRHMLCPTLVPAPLQEAIGENPYVGTDADYAVSSLFSHDFKYTKYIGQVSWPLYAGAATPRSHALPWQEDQHR